MASRVSRRRLGAAARRESILAAAVPEFARLGYDRTRVADIAARVGVTEPVVFQNFGTKVDLFIAVLDRAAAELTEQLGQIHAHSAKGADAVRRLLAHDHLDRMHSGGSLGAIFIDAADHLQPEVRKAAHTAHRRMAQAVAAVLQGGQVDGSVRNDLDPLVLAGLVISQVHARQFRKGHARTSPVLERDVLDALLRVLGSPEKAASTAGVEGKP